MKRTCLAIWLLCGCAAALQFEVATIKPSASTPENPAGAGIHLDGAMVRYVGIDLKLLIGFAWNLRNYQISTPDWMVSTRWDVTAKIPEGVQSKQTPEMLKTLLSERFRMKTHQESREMPVYALVVGKSGLKIKEHADAAGADASSRSRSLDVDTTTNPNVTVVRYNDGAYFTVGNNQFSGYKLSMQIVADALARFADRPVVNMTNLGGLYDFTMEFSPEDFRAMMIRNAIAQGIALPPEVLKLADASSGDTLISAVEKLGLRLERRNAPMDVLVVDEALRNPTEN